MYTFMDDYGDEWTYEIINPYFQHHNLVELSPELDDSHRLISLDGVEFCSCGGTGWTKGVVWSDLISIPLEDLQKTWGWMHDEFITQEMRLQSEIEERIDVALDNGTWTSDFEAEEWARFHSRRLDIALPLFKEHPKEFENRYSFLVQRLTEELIDSV